jgi:hypothetical protein
MDLIRTVDLQIDELVLTGLGPLDAERAAAVFERELARLVRLRGLPADSLREDRITGALAALPPLPATHSAHRLGRELAHALFTGLSATRHADVPLAPEQGPRTTRPRPARSAP